MFKGLLIRWIEFCQLAFFMPEDSTLRVLLSHVNASLGALLLTTRSTPRVWNFVEYKRQKDLLKEELAHTISKVQLSFDTWTVPSYGSMICILGYRSDTAG